MAEIRARDVTVATYARAECQLDDWTGPYRPPDGRTRTAYATANTDRLHHIEQHANGCAPAHATDERTIAACELIRRWAPQADDSPTGKLLDLILQDMAATLRLGAVYATSRPGPPPDGEARELWRQQAGD